jgi:hypothetical protein
MAKSYELAAIERRQRAHDAFDRDNGLHLLRLICREKYSWPGGYEMLAYMADAGVLCADCCRSHFRTIRTATKQRDARSGWMVSGISTAELERDCDNPLVCDHCGKSFGE